MPFSMEIETLENIFQMAIALRMPTMLIDALDPEIAMRKTKFYYRLFSYTFNNIGIL